ncbi:MAG: alkaline phosphatase family protein [Bryobacteraceae bacterium]
MPPSCFWLALPVACLLATGCQGPAATGKKMIVLGIDGMDPGFLERHWDALPELDRLRRGGEFKRLATTTPPQSPVAWSTFITGMNPGGHGIFDFVHRNPDTVLPYSSMSQAAEGGRRLSIGPYLLPLTSGRVESLRRGTPFWKTLSDHGVPVTILRMPTDFPPVECEGHSLAGMGTPDLRGTFGTFAFFTDDKKWKDRKVSGGDVIHVRLENHRTVLRLPGPANSLRKDQAPTYIEIPVAVDPREPVAGFEVEDRRIILKQGEWSGWIPVSFPLVPGMASADGMIRIYVKQVHPQFAVYVSPINIDPSAPAMPISDPESFSQELAESIGLFYTQGMAQDTAALRQGVFSREEYLSQSREVNRQTLKLLDYALDRFRDGVLFFHFFGVDQDSHMLWGRHEDQLLKTYQLVDRALGRVREKAGDATLIVMSDHGFAAFDRAVHLNTWLMREGFLALKDGAKTGDDELLKHVAWRGTKAYALGLNAIYVNQQFREREGIVAEGEETESVLGEIRERLLGLRDPKNGKPVVHGVVAPRDELRGEMLENAPDLIVGYYPGYRSSWQTALGAVPEDIIEDNNDEWRGDHCIAAEFVPGVLLANRKSAAPDPRLEDLTATILREFGIPGTEGMEGRNIYVQTSNQARQGFDGAGKAMH